MSLEMVTDASKSCVFGVAFVARTVKFLVPGTDVVPVRYARDSDASNTRDKDGSTLARSGENMFVMGTLEPAK